MLEQLSHHNIQIKLPLPIIFKELFYHQVLSSVTFHNNYLFQTMMKITVTYEFVPFNFSSKNVDTAKQEFSTFHFNV